MGAAGRLTLYGAGLLVAFGASFALAGVIVPDGFVEQWETGSTGTTERTDDR